MQKLVFRQQWSGLLDFTSQTSKIGRGHTLIGEAVVSVGILATAGIPSCREDLEPHLPSAVPGQDGLARRHLGQVHLVGPLVPWALVVVYGQLPARGSREDALSATALVASHVDAVDVCHRSIVLGVLGNATRAPLRARDADVGKVIWYFTSGQLHILCISRPEAQVAKVVRVLLTVSLGASRKQQKGSD